tara:strand:+ start:77 stop:1513 length:1437 start_codon:yes stop_codon:yes gene_type:complete
VKRIEVYFIMYLALLMAFFGIEAEVADYQDAQERILERIAVEMISDIVQPANFIYEHTNDEDDLTITGSLYGDFIEDELKAELVFENTEKPDIENLSVALVPFESQSTGIGLSYASTVIKSSFFGNSINDKLKVKLAFETPPQFSDSTRGELIDALGKESLADKIINRINEQGIIRDTVDLAMTLVPISVAESLPFNIIVPSLYSAINGSRGDLTVNLRGVNRASGYELNINSETRRRFGISISKRNQKAIIKLGKVQNGNISISARRLSDGDVTRKIVRINAVEPEWKSENPSKAFVNCPIEFDGTLKYMDRPEDDPRYSFRISSDAGISPSPPASTDGRSWRSDSFSGSGEIRLQLLIDGNEIPGMVHTIDIDRPGNPEITSVTKLSSGKREIIIESYGCDNNIEWVRPLGGVRTNTFSLKSENSFSQGEIEVWEADLANNDEMRVEISLRVKDSNGQHTVKKTVLGNVLQGLSRR